MFTLNLKGRLMMVDKPLVMGIINVTPDSFYVDSRKQNLTEIIEQAGKMLTAGAFILDIGGQSTRPGSEPLSAMVETERVLPAIQSIHSHFPEAVISIDTYYATVAQQAVEAGASLVNDISAGEMDGNMLATVARLSVPYICMHRKGTSQTMQENPTYTDVVQEVLDYFIQKIHDCKQAGIKDILIDLGFGFGKTIQHNFQLLKQLSIFRVLEIPILAGLSRKSTIYKTLQTTPEKALNGSTVLHTIALLNGASILRVHDVKEAVECVQLIQAYNKQK